jgi:arylsulfatase A-like enzyme
MTGARSPAGPAIAGAALLLLAALAWWLAGRDTSPAPPAPPAVAAAGPAAPAEVPVVIYLIDTLRADRLGLYGYGKPTSPTIDALARESVVFDRAYAAAPWTLPSVASLYTSRYPCEHGVLRTRLALSPALPTLAEHMQSLGYATASYHQNAFAGTVAGLSRGFQVDETRQDMETLDLDTRDFLARAGGKPFFLYLHSMEPHATYFTPREIVRRFGHVPIDDSEAFRAHWIAYKVMWFADSKAGRPIGATDTTEGIDEAIANIDALRDSVQVMYDASIAFADQELAQAIGELRKAGVWDRALFILLADHGEELADHGMWFHDQSVYEELTHVPLLVRFPGGAFGGQRVAERVSLLDVMPTVLDYLGRADLCSGCRGSSLLPLVDPARGGRYAPAEVPSVRWNEWGYYKPLKTKKGDVNVVVRDGDAKGIWNKEPGTLELYDLAVDPREQSDRAAAEPARAAALAERARAWLAQCEADRVAPVELPPEAMDDKTRERLNAHGYFGG